jgi:Tfp pilus assembly protein PilO
MPPASEQTAVLQELTDTSKDLNLKDISFNPIPRMDKGLYFINGTELKGKGTFLQFLIFFENILRTERFFNIEKIAITNTSSDNKGRFIFVDVNAAIQTFEYNELYRDPLLPAPPTTTNPVTPPPPSAMLPIISPKAEVNS